MFGTHGVICGSCISISPTSRFPECDSYVTAMQESVPILKSWMLKYSGVTCLISATNFQIIEQKKHAYVKKTCNKVLLISKLHSLYYSWNFFWIFEIFLSLEGLMRWISSVLLFLHLKFELIYSASILYVRWEANTVLDVLGVQQYSNLFLWCSNEKRRPQVGEG